ncbi:MAG: ATP-binding protein [Methanobacteriota archaeon]
MQNALQENTLSSFRIIAIEISGEIERLVKNTRDGIVILANNPILRSKNATTSEKLKQLMATQNYLNIYDDITLLDTEGNVITSTTYNYRGEWRTNEWYIQALNGSVVVSDAHIILNPYKAILLFLSPVITENDEIIGVVAGQFDIRQIWDILDSVTIGRTGFIQLINDNHKILSHPNKDKIFDKLPEAQCTIIKTYYPGGAASYRDTDGTESMFAFTPLLADTIYDGNGFWTVIVTQDSEEIFASVISFRIQIFLLALVYAGILIVASFIFSRGIITPIRYLSNITKKIREGNLDAVIEVHSNDEIGDLAESFEKMRESLRNTTSKLIDARESLEKKVEERTLELNEKMKKLQESEVATLNIMEDLQQTIDKLKETQTTIELQNIQLKKLDRIKSDFLNITSHELRTPMSAIKGYIQMIMKQTLGQITKEQQQALTVILRNTDRLDNLIRDILDVSRLESGTMKFVPEKIDTRKMVNEAVETMQPTADLKNIKINTEIEQDIPEMIVDHERIKQVIINIVNNAIKFSPNGTIINVRTKKDKDQVLFEIQDFGRGIPKDKREKIFEIFYQVDSGMDRKFGGAGLGLAISRGIVLSHGGNIWAESEPGNGSTFRFTLPITPVQDLEGKFRDVDIFKLKDAKRAIENDLRNKTVIWEEETKEKGEQP